MEKNWKTENSRFFISQSDANLNPNLSMNIPNIGKTVKICVLFKTITISNNYDYYPKIQIKTNRNKYKTYFLGIMYCFSINLCYLNL